MSSKDISLICGGDMANQEPPGKSILNTTHEKHKPEKSVKIVEPTNYVCEKKIKEKRLKIDKLIVSQIENRIDEFDELKASVLPSKLQRSMNFALKALIVFFIFLLFTMIKASICHSKNCYCEVYWYESILAGIFGIFATSYKDDYPT